MATSPNQKELLPLSKVMLGTMTFGNQSTEEVSFAQLDEFVRLGGVYIDIAERYPVPFSEATAGLSEIIVGKWLSKHTKEFRTKIAIATKVAGPTEPISLKKREEVLTGASPVNDIPAQDLTPSQIERALDASLKRLQTSYVDLYQLHWPSRPVPLFGEESYTERMGNGLYAMRPAGAPPNKDGVPFEDIVKAMGDLISKGKILAWGLSNETPYGLIMFCETARRLGIALPLTIQNDFSLLDRRFDGPLAEAASHYGVKLLAYGPLAGGTLTGKYLPFNGSGHNPSANWRHERWPKFQARYHAVPSMSATKRYSGIAAKHGLTLVQLALGWAATRYYMGSVIIGANSVEQMRENFQAVMTGAKHISTEVLKDINMIHEERPSPNVTYSD